MVWFFIGGIMIAIFVFAFLVVDAVYGYRIYIEADLAKGEGLFLLIINLLGVLIVLSMLGMFALQVFNFIRKKGAFTMPPLTPDAIAKEFGVDLDEVHGFLKGPKGETWESKGEKREMKAEVGSGCCHKYGPPVYY